MSADDVISNYLGHWVLTPVENWIFKEVNAFDRTDEMKKETISNAY